MNYSKFHEMSYRINPVLKNIAAKLDRHHAIIDRDDLIGESMLYLWMEYMKGKLEDKTDSFILQGCYFHLSNYLRKKCVKPTEASLDQLTNDEDTDLHDIIAYSEPGNSDDDYMHAKLIMYGLYGKLIDNRQMKILKMYCDGYTTRDIGKKFNLSHVRVSRLIESAIKKVV